MRFPSQLSSVLSLSFPLQINLMRHEIKFLCQWSIWKLNLQENITMMAFRWTKRSFACACPSSKTLFFTSVNLFCWALHLAPLTFAFIKRVIMRWRSWTAWHAHSSINTHSVLPVLPIWAPAAHVHQPRLLFVADNNDVISLLQTHTHILKGECTAMQLTSQNKLNWIDRKRNLIKLWFKEIQQVMHPLKIMKCSSILVYKS